MIIKLKEYFFRKLGNSEYWYFVNCSQGLPQRNRQREAQWTSSESRWIVVGSNRCFWTVLPVLAACPIRSSRPSKPVLLQNIMGDHWVWVSAYPIPVTRYYDRSHVGESCLFSVNPVATIYQRSSVIDIDLNEDLINGHVHSDPLDPIRID